MRYRLIALAAAAVCLAAASAASAQTRPPTGYVPGQCYTDDGYGRWNSCDNNGGGG